MCKELRRTTEGFWKLFAETSEETSFLLEQKLQNDIHSCASCQKWHTESLICSFCTELPLLQQHVHVAAASLTLESTDRYTKLTVHTTCLAQFGIFWPTHSELGQRVHQSHITIHADQNEEVDAAVGVHGDGKADQSTHGIRKGPVVVLDYIHSPEGQKSR